MEHSGKASLAPAAEKREGLWPGAEQLAIVTAGLATILYVIGFVVVNAYNSALGISDQSLLSARYVSAGVLLCVAAMVYYFFVWQRIVNLASKGFHAPAGSKLFVAYLHNYYLLEVIFACCFFSAWFVALLVRTEVAVLMQICTILAFIIDKLIFKVGMPGTFPRSRFVLSGLVLSSSVLAFAVAGLLDTALAVSFGLVVTFSILGVKILTSEGWADGTDRVWAVAYLSLTAGLLAAVFGMTIYDEISPSFGGGKPAKVQVVFAGGADPEVVRVIEAVRPEVRLISDDQDSVSFLIGEAASAPTVIRMQRGQVAALHFEREDLPSPYRALIERFWASKPVETSPSSVGSSPSAPASAASSR